MTGRDGYSAEVSPCGLYRYSLGRRWGSGPPLVVCMLNPSTADATEDDPTTRRCVAFAKRDGYAALEVVNLFAFRATDPKAMWAAQARGVDVVGPENDDHIDRAARNASGRRLVVAWGKQAKASRRVRAVLDMLSGAHLPIALPPVEVAAWATTHDGHPRHPLYLPGSSVLAPWAPAVPA